MKIELKNITFSERLSQETNCFVGTLYINGKKVGEVRNEGCGGNTNISWNSREDRRIIDECDEWCKSHGEVELTYGQTTFTVNDCLEHRVDELFENWLKDKEKKKQERKMKKMFETSLVIGVPNSTSFFYYKQKQPLRNFNREGLQRWIDQVKERDCVDGKVILNDNLEELGIEV